MRALPAQQLGRAAALSFAVAVLSVAISSHAAGNEFQAPNAGLRVTFDVKTVPETLCDSRPQYIYTVTESKNHHSVVEVATRCGGRAAKVEEGYDRVEFYRSIHWLKKRHVMGNPRHPTSRFETRETLEVGLGDLDLFKTTTPRPHSLPAIRVKFESVEANGSTHDADIPLVGAQTFEIVGREKLVVGAQTHDTFHVRVRTELHRDASDVVEARREEFKRTTRVEVAEEYWYAPKLRFWIKMHSVKVFASGEAHRMTLTAREIRTQ